MNMRPGFRINTGSNEPRSVMYLQQAVESFEDGIVICHEDFRIVYANGSMHRLFPVSHTELLQQQAAQLLKKLTGKDHQSILQESIALKTKQVFEFEYNQTGIWYYVEIFPFANGLNIRFRNITQFKEAHDELLKSRKLYAFISEVNELMLKAQSADEIYTSLCDIAVDVGGFLMSWIGVPDKSSNTLQPAFMAGNAGDYLSSIIPISLLDVATGQGPAGKAIREEKPVFCNDIATDPSMQMWREAALEKGFRSAISLPLQHGRKTNATLTLYSEHPNFFAHEEVSLLVQVSKNISFALQALENEQRRKDAEKQLQKVSTAIEQSSASIVITDTKGIIEYVNPAFCKLTGYTLEETIGKKPSILKTGITSPEAYAQLWQDISNKKDWRGEFCNKTKFGEIYWESATISPIINAAGEITSYVAVKENITEKKKLEKEQRSLVNLIENTTAYVAIGDLDFNLQYANQATKDILELTDEDLAKQVNIDEFVSPNVDELSRQQVIDQLRSEGKWAGEYNFISRSGKEIFVWMVAILHYNEDGSPSHFSSTSVDITRVKESEQQLLLLTSELRELSKHLQHLSEIEKKEIARDIHDEMGQQLTALKFDAKWLKRHVDTFPPEAEERLDALINNINDISASFRKIHSALHPNILEDLGLQGALEWLVSNFTHKTKLAVNFRCRTEDFVFNPTINLTIYRVAQECLTNIARYAQATQVHFYVEIHKGLINISIKDNGVGFEFQEVDTRLHHGLLGMRERLNSVNGTFRIETHPGKGTKISACIPLDNNCIGIEK